MGAFSVYMTARQDARDQVFDLLETAKKIGNC